MTRNEVLKKLEDARDAIKKYKAEGLDKPILQAERDEVQHIKRSSEMLISEARTIGAAGNPCPACGGSGRV